MFCHTGFALLSEEWKRVVCLSLAVSTSLFPGLLSAGMFDPSGTLFHTEMNSLSHNLQLVAWCLMTLDHEPSVSHVLGVSCSRVEAIGSAGTTKQD